MIKWGTWDKFCNTKWLGSTGTNLILEQLGGDYYIVRATERSEKCGLYHGVWDDDAPKNELQGQFIAEFPTEEAAKAAAELIGGGL